jgi:hypothetical protein
MPRRPTAILSIIAMSSRPGRIHWKTSLMLSSGSGAMNDRSINTWLFDPWRTFAMDSRQASNKTEGTGTTAIHSVLSQYNQIVINPCCGPDTLRRARSSSFLLSRTFSGTDIKRVEQFFTDDVCLSFPIGPETSSILTSTTADEESASTSSIQSFLTPPRTRRQQQHEPVIRQKRTKKMSHRSSATARRLPAFPQRPPRPIIRRVCLLKDCDCPYHQVLERSLGPIDVDEFCDEATEEECDKTVVTSILKDLEESFRSVDMATGSSSPPLSLCFKQSKSSLASGETSTSSDTTEDPWWRVRVTVTGSQAVIQEERPPPLDDSDIVSLADSSGSQVTGPAECVAEVEACQEELSIVEEFIVDEIEYSRQLMGYLEGTEPYVISVSSADDVRRWVTEQFRDADIIPGRTSPGRSRGSSGQKSQKSHVSSFYPYSIPESAVEI